MDIFTRERKMITTAYGQTYSLTREQIMAQPEGEAILRMKARVNNMTLESAIGQFIDEEYPTGFIWDENGDEVANRQKEAELVSAML